MTTVTPQPLSNPFQYSSEELVYLAVERLSSLNINLIEFRSMLYGRMNVPHKFIIIIHLSFSLYDSKCVLFHVYPSTLLVEDKHQCVAHSLIWDCRLLFNQPILTQGDCMKQITHSSKPGLVSYFILLPSSFASLTPDNLCPTPLSILMIAQTHQWYIIICH